MSAHSYDPYQPPVVSLEAPSPSPLDVRSVYRAAYASFSAQTWALTLAAMVHGAVSSFLGHGVELVTEGRVPIVGYAARFFIETFLYTGMIRISLDAARRKKVRLATLFSGGDVLLPSLLAAVCTSIAIMIGLLCAIVPGIFLTIGLCFVNILIADRGLGPIEACRESLRLTRGHKWSLVKLGLVGTVVVLIGVLALVVGIFPASALAQLIMVHAYLRLSAET